MCIGIVALGCRVLGIFLKNAVWIHPPTHKINNRGEPKALIFYGVDLEQYGFS